MDHNGGKISGEFQLGVGHLFSLGRALDVCGSAVFFWALVASGRLLGPGLECVNSSSNNSPLENRSISGCYPGQMLIPSWMSHSRNWESRYLFVKINENSVPELIVLVLRVICSIGSLSLNDID
ncbi:unnamed protein product [Brassica rapa]|uniref:Uncharacterized protein n=2 Tax=Brassica campestris TaxID=3711 RepID=A0A8D9DA21_BRACM|nr:unnamed protein product [Brassica rapa]